MGLNAHLGRLVARRRDLIARHLALQRAQQQQIERAEQQQQQTEGRGEAGRSQGDEEGTHERSAKQEGSEDMGLTAAGVGPAAEGPPPAAASDPFAFMPESQEGSQPRGTVGAQAPEAGAAAAGTAAAQVDAHRRGRGTGVVDNRDDASDEEEEADGDGQGARVVAPVPPLPALPLWWLWELQLLLHVLENATFTHVANENDLLGLRVSPAGASQPGVPPAAAAAATAPSQGAGAGGPDLAPASQPIMPPSQGIQPLRFHSQGEDGGAAGQGAGLLQRSRCPPGGSQSGQVLGGSQAGPGGMGSQPWQPSQQTMELMMHLEAQDQEAAAAGGARGAGAGMGGEGRREGPAAAGDGGTPFVTVLLNTIRELSEVAWPGARVSERAAEAGAGAYGTVTAADGEQELGEGVPAEVAAGARECCQAAVAVLMNLTHEHEDGVAAVAAAGGLEAVGGLVWRCCRPQGLQQAQKQGPDATAAAAGAVQEQGQQGQRQLSGARDGEAAVQALTVRRGAVLEQIEVGGEIREGAPFLLSRHVLPSRLSV